MTQDSQNETLRSQQLITV